MKIISITVNGEQRDVSAGSIAAVGRDFMSMNIFGLNPTISFFRGLTTSVAGFVNADQWYKPGDLGAFKMGLGDAY